MSYEKTNGYKNILTNFHGTAFSMPENSGIFLENGVVEVVGYSKIAIVRQEDNKVEYIDPRTSFKL